MTARLLSLATLALAGCTQILGIEDFRGPDGPPDGQPRPPLRFSGVVQASQGGGPGSPTAGVMLEFFRLPQRTRTAFTVSSTGGVYNLDVPFDGTPLDGYIRAELPGSPLFKSFIFLERPTSVPAIINVDLGDSILVQQIASLYGDNPGPGASAVLMQVADTIGIPIIGASVQTTPPGLKVRYDDQNGQPSPVATVTGPGGGAFLFDIASGTGITLSGSRAGLIFGPVSLPPAEAASVYFVTLRETGAN